MTKPTSKLDVLVENCFTLFLFHLHTTAAKRWVRENCPEVTYFGDALAVEHRYAEAVAHGMVSDGLRVA